MFNLDTPITVICDEATPEKECVVRFPSDGEWRQWACDCGLRRSSQRGRPAKWQLACAALFRKIRTDSGPSLTSKEIEAVIERLASTELLAFERDRGELVIKLRVIGADTTHRLRLPTVQERQASSTAIFRDRQRHFDVAVALYDNLLVSVEGYAGSVPAIHKVAIIADESEHHLSKS